MSRSSIEIENQTLRSPLALSQQKTLNHKIPKTANNSSLSSVMGLHFKILA
jgi:hypothetical protein